MLRTLVAWPLGILNTVLWGTVSLAGSLVDGSGAWAHACMVWWSRINLGLIGTRVVLEGLEHIRRDEPQVFAANHQSSLDILVLAACLPVPFRFVAKRELFSLPFLGWHMRRSGFIAVDRDNPRQAARTLLTAAARVGSGMNAVVFPEGTRSPDGSLLPFRGGAFLLAIRSGVRVTPIAIQGTGDILPKRRWSIRPARARVTVLAPIDSRCWSGDRDGLARAVRDAIQETLRTA